MFKRRKMTIKIYNKKRKKKYQRTLKFRKGKRKNKRIKFYSTLRKKKLEKDLEDKKLNKLSVRLTQQKKKETKIKITKNSRKVSKMKKYFANILLRKYRRKKKYKIKRKFLTKIKRIFFYRDRKIQPTWVLKKLAYIISYVKMYNYVYKNKKIVHNDKKIFSLFVKNNYNKKKSLKKKTFIYDKNNYNFMINKKEVTSAKTYRKYELNSHTILLKIKNAIWNILYFFKTKNKRKRRKSRNLRFHLRMLNKYSSFTKHRYRKKNIYIKKNKNYTKKKVKIKLKNNSIRKIKVKTYKKKYIKALKIKNLLKILKKKKQKNNKNIRLIQNFLHYIKKETLSVNTIIKRKQKRKFFWLTSLYFTKNDIKNSFCLRMLRKPLALQKLLMLQRK